MNLNKAENRHFKMEQSQEGSATCLANLEAILGDNGSDMDVYSLGRSLYKYTECGPWLSVLLHDGTWKHTGDLLDVKNDDVRGLLVGSIVEGSDAEVKGDLIDLLLYEDTAECVRDFLEQVEKVNAEASALWEEANADDLQE